MQDGSCLLNTEENVFLIFFFVIIREQEDQSLDFVCEIRCNLLRAFLTFDQNKI